MCSHGTLQNSPSGCWGIFCVADSISLEVRGNRAVQCSLLGLPLFVKYGTVFDAEVFSFLQSLFPHCFIVNT